MTRTRAAIVFRHAETAPGFIAPDEETLPPMKWNGHLLTTEHHSLGHQSRKSARHTAVRYRMPLCLEAIFRKLIFTEQDTSSISHNRWNLPADYNSRSQNGQNVRGKSIDGCERLQRRTAQNTPSQSVKIGESQSHCVVAYVGQQTARQFYLSVPTIGTRGTVFPRR
jgi:hypothetical protein